MSELILRPSKRYPDRPCALEIRIHESLGPTEYISLCHVTRGIADYLVDHMKVASWLFGEPK